MKKLVLYFGLFAAIAGFSVNNAQGQDTHEAGEAITYNLPAMKVLDLEGTAPSLTFAAPTDAGDAVAAVTSNTSWINYTSIVNSGATNKVTVDLSGTAVPAGTTLKVVAAVDAGAGDGTVGTATAEVTLSTTAQDLITGIGSCYTGNGNTSGHQLTYTWSVNSTGYASAVSASAADITATYTIVASGI